MAALSHNVVPWCLRVRAPYLCAVQACHVRARLATSPPIVFLQQQRKDQDRKRTAVNWGCNPETLENGPLLQEWLSKEGVSLQKLVLERVDSGGRGLVASQKLRRGERVLFIPDTLIITPESEWGCAEAGEVMKQAGLPEWPRLAVYLISEASLGRSSRWFAYIATLPRTPTSILQWKEEEVNAWLAASPLREQALHCITDVTVTYEDLQVTIFAKHPELFPSKVYTLETFKWAFGILFSRLVRLPSSGQLALVPWADMLNHSPQADTFLDYRSDGKSVVFGTERSYEPGEQVFLSYGNRSNSELLLAYGFIPSELNPDDSVELQVTLDQNDDLYEAKLSALNEHGLSSPQRFPVRRDGMPAQLLAYARLAVSPASFAPKFSQMAAAAKAAGSRSTDKQSLLSEEDEMRAYELILAVCETSIANYTRFLEKNVELPYSKSTGGSSQPKLAELAVALCESECRILYRLQHILRTELRELRYSTSAGSSGADGRAKRSNRGLFGLFK